MNPERGIIKSTNRENKRRKRKEMGVSGRSMKSTILPVIEKRYRNVKAKQEAEAQAKKARE